ncbi:IS5 family transposase [Streptomyces sp. NPDC048489]|uniref:IS5 family transposase n=1 Tax=Streptomyces sp. NPDC048489 TaxID=3154504 RepID=UPI0034191D0A
MPPAFWRGNTTLENLELCGDGLDFLALMVKVAGLHGGAHLGSVFEDHRVVDHGGVIRRHELTDLEWELLAPLMPRAATGRRRVSDRQVINGMVYKIRTGISWRDLPERYGSWQTVYTRFRRYALDGVFTRALQQTQAQADAAGDIDWLVQIDSTIVRTHQHAAATGRKRGSAGRTNWTITPSVDPEAD